MDGVLVGAGLVLMGLGALIALGVAVPVMRRKRREAVEEVLAGARTRWDENDRAWGQRVDELGEQIVFINKDRAALEQRVAALQAEVAQAYSAGVETGKQIEKTELTADALIVHETRNEHGQFAPIPGAPRKRVHSKKKA